MAVPELGIFEPESLGGGWILRRRGAEHAIRAELDLTDRPVLAVADSGLGWRRNLTTRQAELLLLLHLAGLQGISQAGLSRALYGDSDHLVTVRVELSRLRRAIGDLIAPRPYRIAPKVDLKLRPADKMELSATGLLRNTSAPGLQSLRMPLAHE
jgi:hypothetical protein